MIPFYHDLLWTFVRFRRILQNTLAEIDQLDTFPLLHRKIIRGEYLVGSIYIAEFGYVSSNAIKEPFQTKLTYPCRLIKLAFLAFFLRFLPPGYNRRAVYVVATVVGLFTLATTLVSKSSAFLIIFQSSPRCIAGFRFPLPYHISSLE